MTEVRLRQLVGASTTQVEGCSHQDESVAEGRRGGAGGGGGGAPKMGPSSKPAKQAGMVAGARAELRAPSEPAELRRCGSST